jgi:hypothetical protein
MWPEKFARHDFSSEGPHQHDLKAERKVFAGDVEQASVFPIAQVLQIGWAVAVSRIASEQTRLERAASKGRACLARVVLPVPAWPEKRMSRGGFIIEMFSKWQCRLLTEKLVSCRCSK